MREKGHAPSQSVRESGNWTKKHLGFTTPQRKPGPLNPAPGRVKYQGRGSLWGQKPTRKGDGVLSPSEMRVCKFQLLGGRVRAAAMAERFQKWREAGGRTRHLASVKSKRKERPENAQGNMGSAEPVWWWIRGCGWTGSITLRWQQAAEHCWEAGWEGPNPSAEPGSASDKGTQGIAAAH